MADTSGKALMERLLERKAQNYGGLRMGQLSWACKLPSSDGGASKEPEVVCYNEFNPASRLEDLIGTDPTTRLDTIKAIVSEPSQIEPALDLFFEAIKMAPNQKVEVKVSQYCKRGTMNNHAATDNEFVVFPREAVKGKTSTEVRQMIQKAKQSIYALCYR